MPAEKSKKSTDNARNTKSKLYNTDGHRKAAAGMCFSDRVRAGLMAMLVGRGMASDSKGEDL